MPADGISAAATKGLRQVLLAARGPVQRSACEAYNVGRPVGRVHGTHFFGVDGSPDVCPEVVHLEAFADLANLTHDLAALQASCSRRLRHQSVVSFRPCGNTPPTGG